LTTLKRKLERFSDRKVLFSDLFDTLLHRKVHPNYTIRLWAKFLIREFGLNLSGEELYDIRLDSITYLGKKQGRSVLEVKYSDVVKEIFNRLITTDLIHDISYGRFKKVFQRADFVAETSVQFKNEKLIAALTSLKQEGYQIYLLSDFYLSKKLISNILDFHKMSHLFDDIFLSCSSRKSKEKGALYPHVLEKLNIAPENTLMIGDNKTSDVDNANKYGIEAIHLKRLTHKFRNKKNLFGKDENDFIRACQIVENACKKSEHPFSEYAIHFYFFTERLYMKARQKGLKNLFFLAREGLYLKRLFDCYQEMNLFKSETKIQTHYLKASRQSATQVALRPLPKENFETLHKKFGRMSLDDFLDWLSIADDTKNRIVKELGSSLDNTYTNFFVSDTMNRLRENITFQKAYEQNRREQKVAFRQYLYSFDANLEEEGIHVVDVGWGGTMQESIYKFLKKKIPVTGYYLGLKEIYKIEEKTKRYGLNFSIYPSHGFSDNILKANGQLYEQLLAAPHGSTLAYAVDGSESPTVEFHEKNEKYVFDNFIGPIQEYMFVAFQNLFHLLRPIDYSQRMAQDFMTDMALRIGILADKKKIKFVDQISKGFYQNVGENKVGIALGPKQLKKSKSGLLKNFFKSPEQVFRYLVKVKPFLYGKGMYWISWPINLGYYYIKFNSWFKKKWLNKGLVS